MPSDKPIYGPFAVDPPITAAEALARVQALVDGKLGVYGLGAGDYRPEAGDEPYTPSAHGPAADCRVVFLHGYKVKAHRPGFNRWQPTGRRQNALAPALAGFMKQGETVVDDVNYNSLIEDGFFNKELCVAFVGVGMAGAPGYPQPGDIIAYPTINLPGHPQPFIGHGAMVESVPDGWKPSDGWHALTTLQCKGPPGRGPAVVRVDGSAFDHHDQDWPKLIHRTVLLRPKLRP